MAGGLAVASVVLVPAAQADPQSTGVWGPGFDWPALPVHTTVLPDGRVMGFGGGTDGQQNTFSYAVWDPSEGDTSDAVTELPNTTSANFFCSTQLLDPATGNVLIAGGDMTSMAPGGEHTEDHTTNTGNQTSNVFRPGDDEVDEGPPLSEPRWYATSTVLPDGRTLIQGGADRYAGVGAATPEVYDPETEEWSRLTGISDPDFYGTDEWRWWYPRSWVAPNGRVLSVTGSVMAELDPSGDGSLTRVGTLSGGNIGATSTAVMYRPGLILQVGGGAVNNSDDRPASAAATIIDIRSGTPVVTAAAPMASARHWATATVLPTGDVLVTGGGARNNMVEGATTAPELWNPETNTWRTLAAEDTPRLYHSVAALLPDGRVLSAGGGAPGPVLGLTSQVFSPPYLFAGVDPAARPVLSDAPSEVVAGEDFTVDVESGSPIAEMALIKTTAVTHSFNNEQRYIPLEFEQSGSTLSASAPENAFDMPPGWYQLWAVDQAGVPSISAIVRVPIQD